MLRFAIIVEPGVIKTLETLVNLSIFSHLRETDIPPWPGKGYLQSLRSDPAKNAPAFRKVKHTLRKEMFEKGYVQNLNIPGHLSGFPKWSWVDDHFVTIEKLKKCVRISK